jgi:hypothetical protein
MENYNIVSKPYKTVNILLRRRYNNLVTFVIAQNSYLGKTGKLTPRSIQEAFSQTYKIRMAGVWLREALYNYTQVWRIKRRKAG